MAKFNIKSYFTFLSRNKAYTAVNVFGLAVSLMFVIVIGLYAWQEFSIDRQHSKAGHIYAIGIQYDGDHTPMANSHHAVLRYMQKHYPEIEQTCGFVKGSLRIPDRGNTVNASVLETDSTFFSMFDFKLLRGDRRTCLAQKGNIVVTEGFARRFFGTDDVLGRPIVTEDQLRFRITGVVQDFDHTIIKDDVDAIIDFSYRERENQSDMDKYFPHSVSLGGAAAFVQVREGHDFMQKEKDVQRYFQEFWPRDKDDFFQFVPVLLPLDHLYFSGCKYSGSLVLGNYKLVSILAAVALVILLFSIMNYINLTVAQSGYRAREMATRRLFGCTKSGVGGNMFGESLVMCLLSLAIAVAFACVFAPYMGRLLETSISLKPLFSPGGVAVIAAFVLVVSLLAGVLPATILSKVKPIEVVRGTFRKQTKLVFSRIFITVQNVITITMLSCALIMSLQMLHLTKAPLGFKTENNIVIYGQTAFAGSGLDVFLDKVRALPEVKAAAPSIGNPADGGNNNTIMIEGDKEHTGFQMFTATPDFMKIYGITLKHDLHAEGDSILYMNDLALKAFHMKPTDTHMSDRYDQGYFWRFPENPTLGGVINNIRLRNILEEQRPIMLLITKKVVEPWCISVQVEGDPVEAYAKIKDIYKEVFHEELEQYWPPFVDKQVEVYFKDELRTTKIVTLFAFVAIVISLLGLVAMSTYFIQQRAKEIAIRKVFGSTGNQIRTRLIRSFLLYVGIAFVIAVPIIVHFMSDWIAQYSYRITWWPYIIVAGVIVLLISYAAVAVQSWIAAGENPVKNIKQE